MSRADRASPGRILRALCTTAILAILAACSQPAHQSALQETAKYVAHAHGNYTPPGPPEDPWGPYIREAAERYDIPETWVRALMHVESGGHEYLNGGLVTSGAGAMGLMQVMPETYDELRDRYNLGDDPFDPHDNILAGVAYMREMYDVYGTPGFLAAYNAGPARLDDYLANLKPLPDETRHYVAMIAPNLAGIYPNNRSAADEFASNALPMNVPPGLRYGRPVMIASNNRGHGRNSRHMPIEVASLPEPSRHGRGMVQQVALALPPEPPPPPRGRGGFRLIASASAAEAPIHRGAAGGQWAIQVGAYGSQEMAHGALNTAMGHAHSELAVAHEHVASVHQGHGVLWRARMVGMSRESAMGACGKLAHSHATCIVLAPDSQS